MALDSRNNLATLQNLKGPPKWGFGVFWGEGLRYLVGTP